MFEYSYIYSASIFVSLEENPKLKRIIIFYLFFGILLPCYKPTTQLSLWMNYIQYFDLQVLSIDIDCIVC